MNISNHTKMAQILQALRAGDLELSQIQERWNSSANSQLRIMMDQGYIRLSGPRFGQRYRITDAGRAACPERRTPPSPAVRGRAGEGDVEASAKTGSHA